MIASVQNVLKNEAGAVKKLRAIATTISNIPPHDGKIKIYPIVATLMRSFISQPLSPNETSALFYAQVEQSYQN